MQLVYFPLAYITIRPIIYGYNVHRINEIHRCILQIQKFLMCETASFNSITDQLFTKIVFTELMKSM